MNNSYDLMVVGGGASGLMAAGQAGERGLKVLLLEKNKRVGEKLRISGGGRCNITNAEEDERVLLKKYGKAEQFLYSLFAQFGVKDTFSFFESQGLPLVVEGGKRAFPATHKATDVVRVLEAYIKKGGVEVRTESPVTKVVSKDGSIVMLHSGKETFSAKEYLFATGSLSHKETGSTGDGFSWLTSLGHTIAAPTPTLVPLAVKEDWVKALAGTTAPLLKVSFFVDNKRGHTIKGKILFTHFGLSGPLILNSAQKVADLLHTGTVTSTIDMFPEDDYIDVEKKILKIFDENKNKELKNIIKDIVPEGMHKGVTMLLEEVLDISTKVHSVSKEDRKKIIYLFKALPLTIDGLMGFDRAVIADGGVELKEIDLKTMRSKKVTNLLVTGDLLNISRPTGGFSLQLCWSTGYVAGKHAGQSV